MAAHSAVPNVGPSPQRNRARAWARMITAVIVAGGLLVPALPAVAHAVAPTRAQANVADSPAATTMTLNPPSSAPAGVLHTIGITIDGNNPTGTVTFSLASAPLGYAIVSNGIGAFTTGSLTEGTHVITANYSGDANNQPTAAVVTITVTAPQSLLPTNISIVSSPTTDVRSPMTMEVTVSSPDGVPEVNRAVAVTVTRASDHSPVFYANLTTDDSGTANLVIPAQEIGTYNVAITTAQTASHVAGSLFTVYSVTPVVTTTTLAITPVAYNGALLAFTDTTYTATVTPAMAGIPVKFLRASFGGSQVFGTAITGANGVATVTERTGEMTILPMIVSAKVETTDPNIFSSTSEPRPVLVSPRPVNVTVNAASTAPFGGVALVDVVLPDAPAEMVNALVEVRRGDFVIASQRIANHDGVLGTNDLGIPSPIAAGPENLTVSVISPSISLVMNPVTQVVTIDWTRAAHTIDIEAFQSVDAMTPMPIAATVTDAAGGAVSGRDVTLTVTPVDGTTPVFTADLTTDAEGAAAATAPALPVGSYRIDVTAPETDTLAAVSQSRTYDVVPIEPTVTVATPPAVVHGSAVSITATVDGDNPSGVIEFVDGQTVLGTATLASGEATLNTNTLTAGEHTIVARYLGDDRHAAASASAIATVAPWTSMITADLSSDAVTVGDTLTLDVVVALVDPTITTMARALGAAVQASGTVELLINGDAVGAPVALVDGAATLVVPSTQAGAVSVAARFVPTDSSMTAATSAARTVTITAAPEPTPEPSIEPTPEPSPEPPVEPTPEPSVEPTREPSGEPSVSPSEPVATPNPALAATGSAQLHGFAPALVLLLGGLALAVGRMTRKQRS